MEQDGAAHFCLDDYDAYGFDFDGCLIKYKWEPFFKLAHTYVVTKLIKARGYKAELFRPYDQAWKDMMVRGILVDTKRGNLLKVMEDGHIQRVYHGENSMSESDISRTYHGSKLPVFEEFLKDFNHKKEFHIIDNQFEGPNVMVYAELVRAYDEKKLNKESYQHIWDDVFYSYVQFFQGEAGDVAPGFMDITTNPAEYSATASTGLKSWLKRLKRRNKTVFLMTSSHKAYAEPMLSFLLGKDVEDYFDFFLGIAGKPLFFHRDETHEYMDMATENQDPVVEKLEPGHWYHGGSLPNLTRLLADFSGLKKPKVLYVGDGLKNDVVPSKVFAQWGTLLILEGLEFVADTREPTDDECKQSSQTPRHLKMIDKQERRYLAENQVWGSFFAENGRETISVRAVRENCDLVVPWLDYIIDFPVDHKFSTFESHKNREGYFPCRLSDKS